MLLPRPLQQAVPATSLPSLLYDPLDYAWQFLDISHHQQTKPGLYGSWPTLRAAAGRGQHAKRDKICLPGVPNFWVLNYELRDSLKRLGSLVGLPSKTLSRRPRI